jgi:hypothetical protein
MVVIEFRRPEAVAGDMLGGEHGVFHPGIAGDADPLVHIKLVGRVERGGMASVGKFRAGVGAHPVVDEHAEFQRLPFPELLDAQALGAAFGGDVSFVTHDYLVTSIKQNSYALI